jgi:general stress protein YciG
MASIGRKGGQTVSRDRQHMAQIGRKGGQARSDGEVRNEESRERAER